ncbi:hypothetical protein P879_05640 [Paragonimus westermani]|uniref:Uncharacterized protein n=1 Tax=Paragonimus westermani TaxID=34504 RepID=A0A8T0DJ78_9TREM|nr:hypothetical protein P879_05640 [Paragonimus westermani]
MPQQHRFGLTLDGPLLFLTCNRSGKHYPTKPFDVFHCGPYSVVNAIVQSGKVTAKRYQSEGVYRSLMLHSRRSDLLMPPIMFEWHEKAYLGGAHGFDRTLPTLIKCLPFKLESDAGYTAQNINPLFPVVEWSPNYPVDIDSETTQFVSAANCQSIWESIVHSVCLK